MFQILITCYSELVEVDEDDDCFTAPVVQLFKPQISNSGDNADIDSNGLPLDTGRDCM